MTEYRKKPVVISAWQLGGAEPMPQWLHLGALRDAWRPGGNGSMEIITLEGAMRAEPGDWIIRGVKGELYPCKPDIFAATYEPVDESEEGKS